MKPPLLPTVRDLRIAPVESVLRFARALGVDVPRREGESDGSWRVRLAYAIAREQKRISRLPR